MTTLTPAKKKEVSEKKRLASQNNINKAREKRLGDKKRQKELREMYGISSDDEEEVSEEEGTDLEEESVIFKAIQKKPPASEVEALRKEIETLKAAKVVRKPRQKKVVYVEPVVEEEETAKEVKPTPEPVKVKEVKEPVKEPTKEPTPTPEPTKVKSKIQQLTIEERVNLILGRSVGKK